MSDENIDEIEKMLDRSAAEGEADDWWWTICSALLCRVEELEKRTSGPGYNFVPGDTIASTVAYPKVNDILNLCDDYTVGKVEVIGLNEPVDHRSSFAKAFGLKISVVPPAAEGVTVGKVRRFRSKAKENAGMEWQIHPSGLITCTHDGDEPLVSTYEDYAGLLTVPGIIEITEPDPPKTAEADTIDALRRRVAFHRLTIVRLSTCRDTKLCDTCAAMAKKALLLSEIPYIAQEASQ